ncbi:MAG: MarR family winged helix-turn-helix transcriptional regulator [Planctomycetota bacterium]
MPDSEETLQSMGEEIFQIYRLIAIARSRRPSAKGDLSETEFLTLDSLVREEPLTIGEVQRRIGVVPAQMSRIVRAIETQGGRGLVQCNINAEDRRRIDLALTDEGKEVYDQFKHNRLGSMIAILQALEPEDRLHFMRILRKIRETFEHLLDKP